MSYDLLEPKAPSMFRRTMVHLFILATKYGSGKISSQESCVWSSRVKYSVSCHVRPGRPEHANGINLAPTYRDMNNK
jgi:hypothetical protein